MRLALSAVMPGAEAERSNLDDVGPITLNGKPLRMPIRVYGPEPDWAAVQSRGNLDASLIGCGYSRHHDGFVRERALAHIGTLDEPWVAPFVVQLLGEYVIEIAERAASAAGDPPRPSFVAFVRQNPDFLDLTTARATSYWNEYYRRRFTSKSSYPPLIALARLRASIDRTV